jgi:hypothetical protein
METLLVILLVLTLLVGLPLAAVAGAIFWARWQLRRKNRVVPTAPSPAPVVWLAMPHQPARLHRRLQVAVRVVRVHAGLPDRPGRRARNLSVGGATGTVGDLIAQLEAEARQLDLEITRVSRAPKQVRKQVLFDLDRRVLHVEQLAGRVAQMAVDDALQALPPGDPNVAALDRLAEQLDHLEQARREVAAVERRAGLVGTAVEPTPEPRPQAS